jgi:AcrR family transcriptional regulator
VLAFRIGARYVGGMATKSRTAQTRHAGRKKVSSYHHGALRTTLIQAARAILESQGFEALTLRAAARHAGVSSAAPYNHFADKASLLAAVATQGFYEFASAMRQEMDAVADPLGRLNATGVAYVSFATSNPGLFKLMFGGGVLQTSNDDDLDAARTSAYDVLRAAVHSVHEAAPQSASLEPVESLRSWALVHGLATMLNEGTIVPQTYGASSARELAHIMLGAPPSEKKGGRLIRASGNRS